jgi:hypothetical protein
MRRALFWTCCILLAATSASAETGAICLFSDATGSECNIVDAGGLVQVYIVHTQTDGATASQFKLDASQAGWTWLGDSWNFPTAIGTSIYGVAVAYGGCETGPIAVGFVNFLGSVAPDDSPVSIVPDPSVGFIEVIDCNSASLHGGGGTAYVNSSLDCVCEPIQTPILRVDPTSVDFGYADVTRLLTITNVGGGTLTWNVVESIPWLTASPSAGTNTTDVTLTVNRLGLSPGLHTGTLNVSSNGGSESVLVYMTVPPEGPGLGVNPPALPFPPEQSFLALNVYNTGIGDLIWNVAVDQPWLSADPTSGVNAEYVIVGVDRTGLPHGTYYGNVMVASNGGNATVPVTMEVPDPAPILAVVPTSLNFGELQTNKTLGISNAGIDDLTWSITSDQTWMTATPASGVNDDVVTVSVDRTGLSDGFYYGNLSVTSNGGDQIVTVTMVVHVDHPVLSVTPTSRAFGVYETQMNIIVQNEGTGDLDWNITSNQPWLTTNPVSGTNYGYVYVYVDRSGLAPGDYTGGLFVTSNGGAVTVTVTMTVPDPTPRLVVSPASLTFSESETDHTLDIINAGLEDLNWSIAPDQPWLSANPASGTNSTAVNVHVDWTGLSPGTYYGNLFVTSNGGDETVTVAMQVPDPTPRLIVSPVAIAFAQSQTTAPLDIINGGIEDLNWSITSDQTWLVATPSSGVNDTGVVVRAYRQGLPMGIHHATLFVTSNGGNETVAVTMWVGPHPSVSIYFDRNLTQSHANCPYAPAGTVLDSFFVVATNFNMWMNAIEYKIEYPVQMMWIGDAFEPGQLTIGNSPAGVGVTWPLPANAFDALVVQKVLIFWMCQDCGPGNQSVPTRVLPYPGQPTVRAVRWPDLVVVPAVGMTSLLCPLVPVEETTWGDIKSLFE